MSHFDKLVKLPAGFVVVASTANSEFAAIAHESKPIYGERPGSAISGHISRKSQGITTK